jgi:hypothetical protein
VKVKIIENTKKQIIPECFIIFEFGGYWGFKGATKVKNNKSPVTFNLAARHIIKQSMQSTLI